MKKLTKRQKEQKFRDCLSLITDCTNAILFKKILSRKNHEKFGLDSKLWRDDGVGIDLNVKKITANEKLFTWDDREYLEIDEKTETVGDAMVMIARLSEIVSDDLVFNGK